MARISLISNDSTVAVTVRRISGYDMKDIRIVRDTRISRDVRDVSVIEDIMGIRGLGRGLLQILGIFGIY